MGGKEGTRGYLYQAMVSVLNSVVDSDWKYVQLEPDSDEEKVDIKWVFQDNTQKVVQVKSSINNFSKKFIVDELKKLIKDASGAKEYSLLLIGSCDKTTKELINKINKKTLNAKELKEHKISEVDYQKVSVQLENFNLEALKSQINVNLNKFLTQNKINATFSQLEQMTSSIIYVFMESSIVGKEIIKEDFEKKLLEYVISNSQEQLTPDSQLIVLDRMLATYEAKIETFINESRTRMPFNMESDNAILKDSLLEGFFEDFSWKSKINKGLSNFSRTYNSDSFIQEKNIISTLQRIREINLTYPEFRNKLRKEIQSILSDIPDTRTTSSYRVSLIEILKLLDNGFNKVLIITGESGSGKTHLVNSILSNYSIKTGTEYYSIGIPLIFRDNDTEGTIIKTLNNYLDTKYDTLHDFDKIFSNLEEGSSFKVFFLIDDLQKMCLNDASIYKKLKEIIEESTAFDWINWIFTINEYDQFLIIDESNFLRDYCYYERPLTGKLETDLSNMFINMEVLNGKHNTFEKILNNQYNININLSSKLLGSTNSNNIEMFRNNPLMCHVYANTSTDNEIEFINICYFDFIKRYAEIKKKSMVAASKRNLSTIEQKEAIEQDISKVTKFLIDNKKLNFINSEYESLFSELSESFYELRSAQLIIQRRTETNDPLSEDGVRTLNELIFMFKLYWAFKILFQYRETSDWEGYSILRNSFQELKNELLIYKLLYLDFITNNDHLIERVVKDVLSEDNGKEVLFFVFTKMSFESQAILFKYLMNEERVELNRSEVFGLLYFLSNTMAKNIKVPDIFAMLNKYIDDISKNDLGLYLESIVQKKLVRLDNFNRLKKCINQFIFSNNDGINRGISKIAAANFYRVVTMQESNMENIIKQIITYLKSKSKEIVESKPKIGTTFIEYFLRFLFTHLIENSANKLDVHEILRSTDDYFMDEIEVAHILRRSVTVSYGYIYRSIKYQEKETFKGQYINIISNLIDSKNILLKKLAYHFVVDTLHDFKDPDTFLEIEFIHLLKRLNDDESLETFNTESTERRLFIERNLAKLKL